MKNLNQFTSLLAIMFIFSSCEKDDVSTPNESALDGLNLPETHFNYANISLPTHYTTNAFPTQQLFQHAAVEFDNTPVDNPITDAGATLGRVLFYDTKLSGNASVACASCHRAEYGFADPQILSTGFESGSTRRHSMGIVNARFYASGRFFWDERAATLEEQVLMPFQDSVEMGITLEELEQIVSEQAYYPVLFEHAFGDNTISSNRIAKALAQFVRSMVSTTSKYDVARSNAANPLVDFSGFTASENRGKALFYNPIAGVNGGAMICATCHVSEAFIGPVPAGPVGTSNATNNGLDASSTDDLGVYESSGNTNDIGKFKAPSLRNIGVRAPYMHDGRFASLEEVIEHYSTGVQAHPNLSAPLQDPLGNPLQLNLTTTQIADLVAFLETLTDTDMLNDEKYSDPFEE